MHPGPILFCGDPQGQWQHIIDAAEQTRARAGHADLDLFAQSSLAQCQGQAIRLPERFRPGTAFLEAHARRFGFL